MPFTLAVHTPVKDDNGQVRYRRTTPYIRYSNQGVNIFLQQREFYSEGGSPMADVDVPEWVWQQIAKTDPKVLADVGAPERPNVE